MLKERKKGMAADVIREAFTFAVDDIADWITDHSDTTQSPLP